MNQHEVIYQVRTALEVLAAGGVSSGGKFIQGFGSSSSSRSFVQEWQRANAVLKSLLELPAAHNLALMAKVQDGNMKYLEGVFAELVSMLWNDPDAKVRSKVQKYGRTAVEYLVRRWLVGLGSYREFADEFGICSATASAYDGACIGGVLACWLKAACWTLEPICEQFADEELAVA